MPTLAGADLQLLGLGLNDNSAIDFMERTVNGYELPEYSLGPEALLMKIKCSDQIA